MNTQTISHYHELKRILNRIADISYAFSDLRRAVSNAPIEEQIIAYEQLVSEAREIFKENKEYENNK